jgi:hypothetical protein
MGTNYYLHFDPCEKCARSDEPLHIGKSSAGWCFSLHVIPELGINTLDDWRAWWRKWSIYDEYGDRVPIERMEAVVTKRGCPNDWDKEEWSPSGGYTSESDWHDKNHSERGPNNLARHRIDSHCIGHGEGTWDYIVGEFS